MRDCDVLIVGGGPAGCATALSLRAQAPDLRITLLEQSDYQSSRAGEVLPAVARGLLERLNVWSEFSLRKWEPSYATANFWGGDVLRERHGVYSAMGHGWHLDRAAFDALLSQRAVELGVDFHTKTKITGLDRIANGFEVRLSGGWLLQTRFIVDATGRRASIARRLGARPSVLDSLVGLIRYAPSEGITGSRTVIEAFSDGWWYTAPLGSGLRVLACMTDTDIARSRQLHRDHAWRGLLERTQFIRHLAADSNLGKISVHSAGSCYLDVPCGERWLAVGDAACSYDPLSGQGILRALYSGVIASYAIKDCLEGRSPEGLERYRQLLRRGFAGYRSAYARQYTPDQRWAQQAFWQRRAFQGARSLDSVDSQ